MDNNGTYRYSKYDGTPESMPTDGAYAPDFVSGMEYRPNGEERTWSRAGMDNHQTINESQASSYRRSFYSQNEDAASNASSNAASNASSNTASNSKPPKDKKKAGKGAGKIVKTTLVACLAGVLFAGCAIGTLYGVEKLTGYSPFGSGSQLETQTDLASQTGKDADDSSVLLQADANAQTDNADIALSGSDTIDATQATTTNQDTVDSTKVLGSGNTQYLNSVSDVVDEVMPAIVSVSNSYMQNYRSIYGNYQQEVSGSGSGIIVGQNDSELLIATNYHVVENAEKLEVSFIDDSTASASVKGTDSDNDLAVISVPIANLSADTKAAISIATLGDSSTLRAGDGVIAIGNALGYGQSVTTGVISALNRQTEMNQTPLIQTDAAINPGNSGGALLNSKGEVIGINSAKIGGNLVDGIGYAIPIDAASPILSELMNNNAVTISEEEKGYLNIVGVTVSQEVAYQYKIPQGVYIYEAVSEGAAEKVGLKQSDVIVSIDGETISSMNDLQSFLEEHKVGDTVTVVVRRAETGYAEDESVNLVLGEQIN